MTTSHTPSIATLLCLLLTLLDSTSARPSKSAEPRLTTRAPPSNLSAYAPVLTAGTQSLPPPTGTLTYITLGRGTQNYTCPSSSSNTNAPTSLGATATLFDATTLLPAFPSTAQAQTYLDNLPASTVDSSISQIDLPVIGKHFFTASGVPTWELFTSSSSSSHDESGDEEKILYGSSIADIPAPQGADKGPQGYGAVDWKVLRAQAGSVGGLEEVYRVETAGGVAPPAGDCDETVVLVEYAAMYWFYT